MVIEHRSRSLAKAISRRAAGTLDTIIVSFVVTGRVRLALSIGFIELFTKLVLYYLHERLWNRIALGRKKVDESYEIWLQTGNE